MRWGSGWSAEEAYDIYTGASLRDDLDKADTTKGLSRTRVRMNSDR
jgi:hypothetical protein